MTAQSKLHNDAVVEAYDFARIQTLIDVGGGHGAALNAILARYPQMKGVCFRSARSGCNCCYSVSANG
jgi:hypothetical protein